MLNFGPTLEVKNFYTYRKALVNPSLQVSLSDRDFKHLSLFLSKFGYKLNNHVCWEMSDGLFYSYSDGLLSVGLKIEIFKN